MKKSVEKTARKGEFFNQLKLYRNGDYYWFGSIIVERERLTADHNGADFICVGMFDFQVTENVNICIDVLQNLKDREREWYT
jgi:hypothetical protein